ncbi:uncharacterized protein zgc:193726 isoform X1 [Ictalurus punctatus]|uniref:Uncharacterized protein zgc:193726 isoform X1 n=1 Tax=Ictalurus punctatus TaxID=7998 RepID=A0A2D0SCD0_ICTPU|nr:uncharacterized protein zgc:193726 isoform X1 [Ictalurus punctatus]
MLPAWFFSALLLSSVLGFPIDPDDTRNSTSNDKVSSVPPPVNNNSSDPSNPCQDLSRNTTVPGVSNDLLLRSPAAPPCRLPTCFIHDLDSGLRPGDEKAGKAASSSHGPGKK